MAFQIKVCGITNQRDALKALELGADYLGVIVFARSPRAVPPGRIAELLAVIPPGKRVMVDVSTPTDQLEEYRNFNFDFYQIHFDLNIAMGTVAAWSGIVGRERLWLAPRIPASEKYFPQVLMEFADTILLDAYHKDAFGGTGRTGDWQRFSDWSTLYQHKRWVLAGGLSPDNVEGALRLDPHILDVNSGIESAPGIKDHARMEEFFRKARG